MVFSTNNLHDTGRYEITIFFKVASDLPTIATFNSPDFLLGLFFFFSLSVYNATSRKFSNQKISRNHLHKIVFLIYVDILNSNVYRCMNATKINNTNMKYNICFVVASYPSYNRQLWTRFWTGVEPKTEIFAGEKGAKIIYHRRSNC